MNEDGVRVTRIDWLTAIPSLRLLEAFRLGVSLCVLVPVLLLMFLAWGSTQLLGEKSDQLRGRNPGRGLLNVSDFQLPEYLDVINESLALVATGNASQTSSGAASLGLWMLMLGFCGVAAIRSAGCRFCKGTACGMSASLRFSLESWKAILVSALLSWVLLGFLSMAMRIVFWAGTTTNVWIMAMAPLMYVVGCAVLGSGWLLSLAAIGIDRCDGAEALSRGISYVLSRWLRVVFYSIVFCVILMVCDPAVRWLADQACTLASSLYRNPDPLIQDEFRISVRSTLGRFGELIRLSIFLCEIAIAYVLLRNVEDGVSLREIDGGRLNKLSDRMV